MKRVFGFFFSSLVLCFLAGCSDIALSNKIPIVNNITSPYKIEQIERDDGSVDYWWDIDSRIERTASASMESSENCQIKFHSLWNIAGFMVVSGTINDNKNEYPVVLDTGASQAVFVRKNHVRENNLTILPMKNCRTNGCVFGLSYLHSLNIGDIRFIDWPTFYLRRSFAADLFVDTDFIILGLPALKEFKYIIFDAVDKQAEFSPENSFSAQKPDLWDKFPISVEQDFHGNAFLFVQLDIEGVQIELQLDTGSGNGLALGEELWRQIQQNIDQVKLKKGSDFYPYIGTLHCRKAIVPELNIGQRIVNNALVSVLPVDSPLLMDCDGLIGMQCFRNTVIVLDFENSLLWVKK